MTGPNVLTAIGVARAVNSGLNATLADEQAANKRLLELCEDMEKNFCRLNREAYESGVAHGRVDTRFGFFFIGFSSGGITAFLILSLIALA